MNFTAFQCREKNGQGIFSGGAAKKAKQDEFYTQWVDIEREVNAYLEYDPDIFRGKIILLPCDDPKRSNFTKFFAHRIVARLHAAGSDVGRVQIVQDVEDDDDGGGNFHRPWRLPQDCGVLETHVFGQIPSNRTFPNRATLSGVCTATV